MYTEKEKKNKSLKDSEQNSSNDKEIISKRFVIIFNLMKSIIVKYYY